MTHRVLAESAQYVLLHEYETVMIVLRASGVVTVAGFHWGDPACGVIAPDESWFATGGEGILVYSFSTGIRAWLRDGATAFPVSAMRLDGIDRVRFLVDPWSDNASVWLLAPATGVLSKLRDGPDMREQPFQSNVDF